jgi:hypothetical protein
MGISPGEAQVLRNLTENKQQSHEYLFGLYRATVMSNGAEDDASELARDPQFAGRIRVCIHAHQNLTDTMDKFPWAEVPSIGGGSDDVGMFIIPEVGACGYVAFVNGISSSPVWIGGCMTEGISHRASYIHPWTQYPRNRIIYRSRNGHMIEVDDSELNSGIRLTTAAGNFIHFDDHDDNSLNMFVKGNVNEVVNGNKVEVIHGDYKLKVDGIYTKEVKEQRTQCESNHIIGNTNISGDVNIVSGSLKVHNGSIFAMNEGNLIIGGKILTDRSVVILGHTYVHGTIAADHSISTKGRFSERVDNFDQLEEERHPILDQEQEIVANTALNNLETYIDRDV